jgi:uncharacterized membrane protein YagU involved in acid resistance
MDIAGAILAGLAGTAVMTVLMYVAPMMGMQKMDIVGMLGSMFTANKGVATMLGLMAHFLAGAVFALIYALLWSIGFGSVTWLWGLVFGAVHGIVAMVVVPLLMRMHPRATEMAGGAVAKAGMLMAHLVYGLTVALVYAAF